MVQDRTRDLVAPEDPAALGQIPDEVSDQVVRAVETGERIVE